MNPLLSYAVKSLRKNRARTAMTIAGIMMSAALIVALAAFGTSLYRYMQEGYTDKYGDWHMGVRNGQLKDVESICMEKDITETVLAKSIGYADVETTDTDRHYLYLQGVGSEYYEHMPISLTEGRIPQKEDEILLPESFRKVAAQDWEIGSIMELEVGLRLKDGNALWQNIPYGADSYGDTYGSVVADGAEADVKENLQQLQVQRYQVTGFYSTPDSADSAPGYEALTWWDQKAQEDGYHRFSVWFQIENVGNSRFHKVYDELRLVYDYSNIQIPINSELLSIYGIRMTDKNESIAVAVAAVILLLIILTGSVLLIYNAFAISVGERTRQFGLLSSVGATGKQIRGCVLCEAAIVSVSGVFLGIFTGIAIVSAALRIFGGIVAELLGFSVKPHLYVWFPSVVLAAVLAALTVLISAWIPAVRATKVTAIEAIRQNREFHYSEKKKRVPRILEYIFGFEGVLAVTYARRNRKRYRITTMALFLSMVLFISINAFSDYLATVIQAEYKIGNYDLLIQFPLETEFSKEERQEMLEQMRMLDGADSVVQVSFLSYRMPPEANKGHVTADFQEILEKAAHGKTSVTFSVADDESFSDFCREHGLDDRRFFNTEDITVIVNNRFNVSDPGSGNTKIIDGLMEGDGKFYVELTSDFSDISEEGHQGNIVEFTAGYYSESLAPGCNANWDLSVMLPESVAKSIGLWEMADASTSYVMVAPDHRKAMDETEKLLEAKGLAGTVYDQAERQEGNRNLVFILRLLANGFIIMVSVLSIANVFNTISANLMLRQKEFAMLKTVGMTPQGLRRMMNIECLMYGGKAVLFGFPVSVLAAIVMYYNFRKEVIFDFYLPVTSIMIAAGSIFVVVFITMLYTMRRIKKENVIDALRQESF